MSQRNPFLEEHVRLSRRYFMKLGVAGLAAANALTHWAIPVRGEGSLVPSTAEKARRFGSYLTPDSLFGDVSRGDPIPHELPDEKKTEVGMTRDTWKLEVIADPDHNVRLRNPMTKEKGNAIDFAQLMKLAEKHAVRFPKIMTCLNLGCPLGMGVWEGIPLREVIWLAEPREDLRRVFYYGYHNDVEKQMFRSSLPIGRVMEDYFGLPPVILCYKLNGEWLSSERGGPVRILAPEHYGFKNVKWLSHLVLTNNPHSNDTYAEQGNDIDSPMKTFASTLSAPRKIAAGTELPLTGFCQVGIGGLSKVQVSVEPADYKRPKDDPYFLTAPWVDMELLPPPEHWGGAFEGGKLPMPMLGFDSETGKPLKWPMRFCAAHWAGVHPPLTAGKYTFRCRAVDENGTPQPLPRPLRKGGLNVLESFTLEVT